MSKNRFAVGLALAVMLAATNALAGGAVNNPPTSGGGGGAVSSVSATGGGCVTVSPTTGAVLINSSGCAGGGVTSAVAGTGIAVSGATGAVTFSLAPVADQRILGNVSGGSAAPIALTAAQAATFLGGSFLIPGNNLSDLGSASTARTNLGLGTAAVQNVGAFLQPSNNLSDITVAATARTNLGLGTLATQSGTFSGTSSGTNTGDQTFTLTGAVTGTGTGSFVTTFGGKSGGQTVFGDTATTGNLTLQPNSADSTTGRIIASGLGLQSPNGTATNPGVIGATSNTGLVFAAANVQISIGGTNRGYIDVNGFQFLNSTTGTGFLLGVAGQAGVTLATSSGMNLFGSNANRMVVSSVGLQALNTPYVSFASAASVIAQTNGTVMEYGQVPISQASATGALLDAHKYDAVTATFTGTTAITTATGVNFIDVERPTYTDASAVAITNAATFTIKGAPNVGGSLTITNPYAFWVQSGTSLFGGSVAISNTLATPGSGVIVTTDAPTAVVSLSLKYINMQVGGVTTYVLALQ